MPQLDFSGGFAGDHSFEGGSDLLDQQRRDSIVEGVNPITAA